MALNSRTCFTPTSSLVASVERLRDRLFFDFATSGGTAGTFTASPANPFTAVSEGPFGWPGRYALTIASTPQSQWTDGDYCVTFHNTAAANLGVAVAQATMFNGDDGTSRAGYILDETGLDALPTDPASGVPSTFREMQVATMRRTGLGKTVHDPATGMLLHVSDTDAVLWKQPYNATGTAPNVVEVVGKPQAAGGAVLPTGATG